jgi:flavin-binding protein dodecin
MGAAAQESRRAKRRWSAQEAHRMLKMIEVVGTSDASFAVAAKSAVQALIAKGEKVHFFVLQEARGSVRGGKIEFQAVLKVAAEA